MTASPLPDDTHPAPSGGTPRVLGVDLSLAATGLASTTGWCHLITHSELPRKATYRQRQERLATLMGRISEHLTDWWDLIIVEGPSYRSNLPGAFDRAGLWWSVYHRCTNRQIPLAVASPADRMRYATGKGNASKGAVVDAVARRWPDYETGGDDNLADAVVLAAMGADWLGHPLTVVPKTHRGALAAVAWPEVAA